ncbi:Transposase [Streptomyces sp. Ag109_O5-10]|nr:Transposase [Streptomyces sp. Ag109_O5-10]
MTWTARKRSGARISGAVHGTWACGTEVAANSRSGMAVAGSGADGEFVSRAPHSHYRFWTWCRKRSPGRVGQRPQTAGAQYRASLVDPYREYLRKRRAEDPGVPVQHLFEEIKTLGFTGCLNLLHKYINQGRADADRSHISPRRLARMLLTRPDNLTAEQHDLLAKLTAACAEMTQLSAGIRGFAPLLTPHTDNPDALTRWITQVRTADLPHLHAFTRGLDRDIDAVIAALTLPYSNGPTEGVNTKTKRVARQMHGRASFTLLRHRILLG